MLIMKKEYPRFSLPRKMMLATLIPMVIGILICSIFMLTVTFDHYEDWKKEMKDYRVKEEGLILRHLANSRAESVSIVLNDIVNNLVFLDNLQKDMTLQSVLPTATAVDAYSTFSTNNNYPDESTSVYISEDNSINLDANTLKLLDYFMKRCYQELTNNIHQFGYIDTENKIDYRYPLQDMSYLQSLSSCDGEQYDIKCSQNYKNLFSSNLYNLTLLHENDKLTIFLKSSPNVLTAFAFEHTLNNLMNLYEGHTYFVTQNDGNYVLAVDNAFMGDFNNEKLDTVLFPDSPERQAMVWRDLIPIIKRRAAGVTTNRVNLTEGNNFAYIAEASPIHIDLREEHEEGYSVGVLVNEMNTLSNWNDLLKSVQRNQIIQVGIFMFFVLLSLVCSWALTLLIKNLVIIPLNDIEAYLLSKKTIKQVKKKYNRDANMIIDQLVLLDYAQKIIDPAFLLNISLEIQLKHLGKALKLFKGIYNKRCEANTYNLIGNCHFQDSDDKEAVEAYTKAYKLMKDLIHELTEQEANEEKLMSMVSIQEVTLMKDSNWEFERGYLNQSLCRRLQQLCMAKVAHLSEVNDPIQKKKIANEILTFQIEALEFCLLAKQDIIDILKLLIDISDTKRSMLYENTAFEILDWVFDEAVKIENGCELYINIDIGRLRRMGLSINDVNIGNQLCLEYTKFETSWLKQQVFYKKGVLFRDKNEYARACEYFGKAIFEVKFYDPEIRERCATEIHQILSKYSLDSDMNFIVELCNEMSQKKPSVMILFGYQVAVNADINLRIASIIESVLEGCKVGATTLYTDLNCNMAVTHRDCLRRDFDNFFETAQRGEKTMQLYDGIRVAHRGIIKQVPLDVLVVVADNEDAYSSSSTCLEDLYEEINDVKHFVLLEVNILGNNTLKKMIKHDFKGIYIDYDEGINYRKFERALKRILTI